MQTFSFGDEELEFVISGTSRCGEVPIKLYIDTEGASRKFLGDLRIPFLAYLRDNKEVKLMDELRIDGCPDPEASIRFIVTITDLEGENFENFLE